MCHACNLQFIFDSTLEFDPNYRNFFILVCHGERLGSVVLLTRYYRFAYTPVSFKEDGLKVRVLMRIGGDLTTDFKKGGYSIRLIYCIL